MKFEYNQEYHEKKFGNWIKDKNLYKLRCLYAKKKYFKDLIIENKRIFEFGCGIGQNIAWYNNSYGYELNKKLYPFLKEKGIKMFDDLNEIPDDYFDIIITCMVLEHLENPKKTLTFLKDKLKDDGYLITVLPMFSYNKRKEGINETTDGHLFAWTFYEINYLLNFCGFTNILNKKIYRKGIERLKFLPQSLYFFFLSFFGRLFNTFDIIIISKKRSKIK